MDVNKQHDINQRISAISIQQPFAEAITRGIKTIENRSTPYIKLHCDKTRYQHPSKPLKIQCRFCNTNSDDCDFWLHQKENKKNKKQKKNKYKSSKKNETKNNYTGVDFQTNTTIQVC